jgi:hypothetical protein
MLLRRKAFARLRGKDAVVGLLPDYSFRGLNPANRADPGPASAHGIALNRGRDQIVPT